MTSWDLRCSMASIWKASHCQTGTQPTLCHGDHVCNAACVYDQLILHHWKPLLRCVIYADCIKNIWGYFSQRACLKCLPCNITRIICMRCVMDAECVGIVSCHGQGWFEWCGYQHQRDEMFGDLRRLKSEVWSSSSVVLFKPSRNTLAVHQGLVWKILNWEQF